MSTKDNPTIPRLTCGAAEAAKALGVSERTLWQLKKDGRIPFIKIGNRVLYDPVDLAAFVTKCKTHESDTVRS